MATKSILKNIEIKDKKLGQSFANALEAAVNKAENDLSDNRQLSRAHKDLGADEVEKFFECMV